MPSNRPEVLVRLRCTECGQKVTAPLQARLWCGGQQDYDGATTNYHTPMLMRYE